MGRALFTSRQAQRARQAISRQAKLPNGEPDINRLMLMEIRRQISQVVTPRSILVALVCDESPGRLKKFYGHPDAGRVPICRCPHVRPSEGIAVVDARLNKCIDEFCNENCPMNPMAA